MVEALVGKYKLIGVGYAEMPMNGGRMRFRVERYQHDDGSEWGRIVDSEMIPETGRPYLWIPSYGVESASEADYLREEWEHEEKNPNAEHTEWLAEHRERAKRRMETYNELRDQRAALIKRNPVTKGRS